MEGVIVTPRAKTYKRETAGVMLLFLAALTIWGIWEPEAKDASRFYAIFIFTFAAGAFGLDAWSKQIGPRYE